MTVTIDDELWAAMQKHDDIRWSVVMRRAIRDRLEALAALETVARKSALSEDEIERLSIDLGKKINRRA